MILTRTILRTVVTLLVALPLCGCRTTIRPPSGVAPIEKVMLVTGYCSCSKCCEWKRDWLLRPVVATGPNKGSPKVVGRTASGTAARRGTIAADESLFPFGTIMYVDGYGYGRVEDRGRSIKGEHIDLFFNWHGTAIDWGVRKKIRVKIWYPEGKRLSPKTAASQPISKPRKATL